MADTEGFDELNKVLQNLLAISPRRAVAAGAEVIKEAARANVRAKLNQNSKGHLEEQIDVLLIGEDAAEIGIQKDVYGRTHEYGATITPKKAEALHFTIGEEEVFAKKVEIPQRPFLRPAADENRSRVSGAISEAILKMIEEATR